MYITPYIHVCMYVCNQSMVCIVSIQLEVVNVVSSSFFTALQTVEPSKGELLTQVPCCPLRACALIHTCMTYVYVPMFSLHEVVCLRLIYLRTGVVHLCYVRMYRSSCGCEGCWRLLLHPLQPASSLRGAEDRVKGHGRSEWWATRSKEGKGG